MLPEPLVQKTTLFCIRERYVTGWRPVKPPAMPEATSLLNSRGQNTRSTALMVQRVFSYNLPGQSQPGVAIRSRARLTFPVRHKARARNRRPGLRLEHVTSWRVERDGSTDPGYPLFLQPM